MEKEKYILVSCTDENMMIDNEEFDNLADAQKAMREEWESEEPDTECGDRFEEMGALVMNPYVHLWKIIKVSF